MSAGTQRLVDDYLDRLERELADLPRARRAELVDEIAGHIEEARGSLEHESEADIRNLLERLGTPAEIADSTREREGVRPRRRRVLEPIALVSLLVGGVVLPFVGWVIGAVLLWISDAWTTRDKIIGTLVVPGGLLPAVYLSLTPVYAEECSGAIDPATGRVIEEACTGGPSAVAQILGVALLVALVLAPFATMAYLAMRLRRAAPA